MIYGQNHQERQELLKKKHAEAGLVSELYPGVSEIVFRLTYYQRSSRPILMIRTLHFLPQDYAYFHMDCMRDECKDGEFDLTAIVADMIRSNKRVIKGKLCCNGMTVPPGHASIGYEISVQIAKQVKKSSARTG